MVWIAVKDKSKRTSIWIDGYMPNLELLKTLGNNLTDSESNLQNEGEMFEMLVKKRNLHFCEIYLPDTRLNIGIKSNIDIYFCHKMRTGEVPYFPSYVYKEIQKGMKNKNYQPLVFSFSELSFPDGIRCIDRIIESVYFKKRWENSFKDFEMFKNHCYGLLERVNASYSNDRHIYNLKSAIEAIS